jgi:hypothetical protein
MRKKIVLEKKYNNLLLTRQNEQNILTNHIIVKIRQIRNEYILKNDISLENLYCSWSLCSALADNQSFSWSAEFYRKASGAGNEHMGNLYDIKIFIDYSLSDMVLRFSSSPESLRQAKISSLLDEKIIIPEVFIDIEGHENLIW